MGLTHHLRVLGTCVLQVMCTTYLHLQIWIQINQCQFGIAGGIR